MNESETAEEIAKAIAIAEGWDASLWEDGMCETDKRRCYTRAWAVVEVLKGDADE